LVPGGVWSERHGGTNGMGTCLAERAPLIVHRDQHFLARNTGLTCCAAPIFDPAGELAAVLDASGESDRAQQHTLVLVNLSAQAIEKRLFLHRFRDASWCASTAARARSEPRAKGMLAFDADGRIAAVDRNALFQLGCKQAADLMSGAPLERVFNISLPALPRPLPQEVVPPAAGLRNAPRRPLLRPGAGTRIGADLAARRTAGACRRGPTRPRAALDELDFGDPVMARSIRAAKRVASRALPILLVGETGTGKELFARALHAASERAAGPFVAVSCGELSEPLLQVALAQARGGTLFLDDVGELPGTLQARLLHVLEHREAGPGVRRAARGGRPAHRGERGEPRAEDPPPGVPRGPVLPACRGSRLTLPRLCERADKRALIRHRLRAGRRPDTPSVSLSESLIEALCAQRWPGNLRQLRNALRRHDRACAQRPARRRRTCRRLQPRPRVVEPEPTAEG
jgi:transcriptional regulator of acetoin/glycerol metabolism